MLVVAVKVALVLPVGTVTLAGTWTALVSLLRFTVTPGEGAAVKSVTVPVELEPPVTEFGPKVTVLICGTTPMTEMELFCEFAT